VVADLLAGPLGVTVPPFEKALLSSGDLTDINPTEYRADGVVLLQNSEGPTLAVVLEVQLSPKQRKRETWPVYFATVHARLRCAVSLLVLCPDPATATWCAEPIRIGDPGMVLTPVVLGPQQVPVVTDIEQARAIPELAVLSVLAHGGGEDSLPVLSTMVAVLNVFDPEHAEIYLRLILKVLPAAARDSLEEIMTTSAQEHETELGELLFPKTFARGKEEGFARGKAEGEAEGKVTAVLAVLEAREVAVSEEARARISECGDIEVLDTWIRRAVTVSTADELFA